jgi:hypothetical protein
MGGYTIDRPPGEGWKTVVTAKEQRVEFSRDITDGDGNALSKKLIIVKAQWAKDKNIWRLSKQEIAKKYIEYERSDAELYLELSGVAGIKIVDEKENTIHMDNMKLYRCYGKTISPKGDVIMESSMYLFFPPGYKKDDKFIVFYVFDIYKPERIESADLSVILPVIKSLQLDLEKLNE